MNNPLTSLDELIWKQAEKVTNYAYKNLGWDKWDLVHIADNAAITAQLGVGVYTAMVGLTGIEQSTMLRGYYVLLGGLMGPGAALATSHFYKIVNKHRQ